MNVDYNKEGHPVLYLCSSLSVVHREVKSLPGRSLWVQRFRLPPGLRLLDATCLPNDLFAAAVFWLIESHRNPSAEEYPRLGARIAELIAERLHYDGMVVPGVWGKPGDHYSNVIIFRPGDRWKGYIEPGSAPERAP